MTVGAQGYGISSGVLIENCTFNIEHWYAYGDGSSVITPSSSSTTSVASTTSLPSETPATAEEATTRTAAAVGMGVLFALGIAGGIALAVAIKKEKDEEKKDYQIPQSMWDKYGD